MFIYLLLLAVFIVMNLRNYDKLKEITNLTRHRIPLDFKDFISSKWLFFSSQNVALPHNVFHQQRTKKIYLPLRKGIDKWGVTLISVASSLRALLASRDTVQLIPTPLHELLLPDLQLLRIRQFLSKHIFKDLYLFFFFYSTRHCIMTSLPLIIDRLIWTLFRLN